ncbi:ABC transporter permease [Rhodobium gokarnense]|uniref:ABC-2 type transport system permease protein n=1 Tax=Rhodobium gokarnense TaxID=364296 RepID=A0ABT3HG32_9HYPH|nr:ABC transporter permease [Rhodobium gokarnense]MCW2309367.1 ABC-2 type transport system permease protein [Rhodobium gokarnense]
MRLANVLHLGIKELRSLARDPIMLVLIVYAFTFSIYTAATAMKETLHRAPIAIVDEDSSPLAARIAGAFYPPDFLPPQMIKPQELDRRMDIGLDTFALDIPPDFQRDLLAGKKPTIMLSVDATRMTQAFTGNAVIQNIVTGEVNAFLKRYRDVPDTTVNLVTRARFNPTLDNERFLGVMHVIDNVTLLAIILTGAALIREREHGTIEHLLVMPVTPLEIMTSKVWAMGLVVLVACYFAILIIVQGILKVPVEGSMALFLLGTALHLFATTSLGIVLGTVARSMPQFGLLMLLTLLPLQMLSGSTTPRESMPDFVQAIMMAAPNTHFVIIAQAVLFRGADGSVIWPNLLALAAIGTALFTFALARFRKAIVTMA